MIRQIFSNFLNKIENNKTLFPFKTATFGALITAVTIYSHIDTFLKFSTVAQFILEHWRNIIAFPWKIVFDFFSIDVSTTLSGMLTVLCATALVVGSSWTETNKEMTVGFRMSGVSVCVFIGFLYSTLIIVPALYDADVKKLESIGIAIEMLSDIFYVEVQGMDILKEIRYIVPIFIVAIYAIFISLNIWRKSSEKSLTRVRIGFSLIALFTLVLSNFLFVGYDPFNQLINDNFNYWGGSMTILISSSILIFAPFLSSVFMSDPYLSIMRNLSVFAIIAVIFLFDRAAVFVEWISTRLTSP